MPEFTPRKLIGNWREGWALDVHTVRSEFLGYDEFGHACFDTTRSPVGECLYRLKYGSDRSAVDEIVGAAEHFLDSWNPPVDMLVPVPPSTARPWQPVHVLAEEIGRRIGIPAVRCVRRTREAPQLKNVFDLDERLTLLEGLHRTDENAVRGRRVLLFDDLYRSGATLNAVTELLLRESEAKEVYVLTITRTRSIQ